MSRVPNHTFPSAVSAIEVIAELVPEKACEHPRQGDARLLAELGALESLILSGALASHFGNSPLGEAMDSNLPFWKVRTPSASEAKRTESFFPRPIAVTANSVSSRPSSSFPS